MSVRRYPDRPFVGVGVVVMGPEGILLIQRGKPPRQGKWSLPGGAQELGETVVEAGIREIEEETGLTVTIDGLIDVVDSIRPDAEGQVEYHYTLVDFCASVAGGTLHAGGDAMDAKWFSIDAIMEMELWSETKRIINLAIEMHDALN